MTHASARGGARACRAVLLVGGIVACQTIAPQPISTAPENLCSDSPCERYDPGSGTAARCVQGIRDRCETPSAGGRPAFPFWIVVHVADSSFYAPGSTFVFFSDERGEPAFRPPTPGTRVPVCNPAQRCLTMPGLAAVTGEYLVSRAELERVAAGVLGPSDPVSIPVRVAYEPLGNEQAATFPTLPLSEVFGASQLVAPSAGGTLAALYAGAFPFGTYRRVFYPQPPFDAVFPPASAPSKVIASGSVADRFTLAFDDPTGDSRVATVSRDEGLEGWQLWLADAVTKRRISVVRTLRGTTVTTRLDTAGESQGSLSGLRDQVEAVLAPPPSWLGVPRFVTALFSGAGLRNIVYPPLPPPVSVTGVVAQPGDARPLLGYPARVRFTSSSLGTRGEPTSPLLQYEAAVSTDDRGRFATVLPPGSYRAMVEPAFATGFASEEFAVVVDRTVTVLTLQPPPRTLVRGRVALADGRALAEADVLALPEGGDLPARAERARTDDDGRFALELDRAVYNLAITPRAGTGFPRVVLRQEVGASAIDVGVVRVPAPTALSLTLVDSGLNPIVRSVVRIFARPGSSATRPPVEIGMGLTDTTGAVEILLAGEPR